MKTSSWFLSLTFAVINNGAVISAFVSPQPVLKPRANVLPSTSQLKVATASPQITQADLASLSEKGYVVIPNFLPRDLVDDLRDDILNLRRGGAFKEAKIGQDSTNELNKNIRIAETCFLGRNRAELLKISGENSIRDRSGGLYDILDNLCDRLSDLSMKDSSTPLDRSLNELLYAYYPEGGFYRRHRDAIPNSASVLRKYSLLLYLNRDGWSLDKDAGQLRMHLDGGGDECPPGVQPNFIDVDPLGGTLVLFKSEAIPHEVLDTMSERFALVGWFNRPVSASDIANLGEGGNLVQVGMMAVALALVTVGVSTILGQ
jgi:SM-20-related protein